MSGEADDGDGPEKAWLTEPACPIVRGERSGRAAGRGRGGLNGRGGQGVDAGACLGGRVVWLSGGSDDDDDDHRPSGRRAPRPPSTTTSTRRQHRSHRTACSDTAPPLRSASCARGQPSVRWSPSGAPAAAAVLGPRELLLLPPPALARRPCLGPAPVGASARRQAPPAARSARPRAPSLRSRRRRARPASPSFACRARPSRPCTTSWSSPSAAAAAAAPARSGSSHRAGRSRPRGGWSCATSACRRRTGRRWARSLTRASSCTSKVRTSRARRSLPLPYARR